MPEDSTLEEFVLLNDQPVGESRNTDILGSGDAAAEIASLIMGSRHFTPFTLGIDAGWGMGKSSLMLLVQQKLGEYEGVKSVWFNAWTSEGASALEGLIKSALAEVDENILRRALRKMVGRRQLFRFLWITLLIAASFFRLSRIVDELWDRFSVDARSRNKIRAEMAGIFKEWSAQTKRTPSGRMLVIFVDDLDRCSPEAVLAVCEAIKLYLDVPAIVFVIGCDLNILAQTAMEAGNVSQAAASVAYMEKIVQVTYRRPAPDDDKTNRLVAHYAGISGTTSLFTEAVKKIVIDRAGRNPRRIKRLINSFILEYRLDPAWREVGAEALISVILIQHFYSAFYRKLAGPSNRDVIREFLDYTELRNSILRGHSISDEDREFFESHGVRSPNSDGDTLTALHQLEEEVPIEFLSLVKDAEFVSLVRNLSDLDNSGQLQNRLQNRPATTVTTLDLVEDASVAPHTKLTDYDGLRVVWIDDNPDWIRDEIDTLFAGGASVVTATDRKSALELLRRTNRPDVIISDIRRGEDENAGLKDLEEFRRQDLYDGPVVFYTSRLTASRLKAVDSLGAIATTSRDKLMESLQRIVARKSVERAGTE